MILLAALAQQGSPFGKNSRVTWVGEASRVISAAADSRPARGLAGKTYLLVYVKPAADDAEPNAFNSNEAIAASRGSWAFAWHEFAKDDPLLKSWGVTAAPALVGCDLHGNDFVKTTDLSIPSMRRLLTTVSDAVQKYDATLKKDFARAREVVKDDPRKAIKPLVDLLQQARPGYPEVGEALELLAEIAADDWKRVELAASVGIPEGIAVLEEIVRLYRSSPPGVQAEIRIADLELGRGNFQAAVLRLERALKHDARLLRREHEAAASTLDRIRRETRGRDLAELQKQHERARAAETALAARPDDPAASLELGRFLCLVRGDWEKGLPRLAKGSDATLKAAAEKDLAGAAAGAEQAQLGDLWWDLGEKAAADRDGFRVRACHWYDQASASLTGLGRIRIDLRLEECAAFRPGVDLLKLVDPKQDAFSGDWRIEGGALVSPAQSKGGYSSIGIAYAPPEEYTLRITAERKQGDSMFAIGLGSGSMRVAVVLAFGGRKKGRVENGISLIDGRQGDANESTKEGDVLPPGKPVTIVYTVRKSGLTVEIDGKPFIAWNGDLAKLSRNPIWRVPPGNALFVGSDSTVFHVTRMTLTPLAGQGKKLR